MVSRLTFLPASSRLGWVVWYGTPFGGGGQRWRQVGRLAGLFWLRTLLVAAAGGWRLYTPHDEEADALLCLLMCRSRGLRLIQAVACAKNWRNANEARTSRASRLCPAALLRSRLCEVRVCHHNSVTSAVYEVMNGMLWLCRHDPGPARYAVRRRRIPARDQHPAKVRSPLQV